MNNNGDVLGQDVGPNTLNDVSHKILEQVKPMPNITVDMLASEDGKKYICVKFDGKDKPYSAFGRYYRRSADEDREVSQSQLRSMFLESGNYSEWENMLTDYTIEDVDEELLTNAYHEGVAVGRFKDPYDSVESVLTRLNLYRSGKLTNAGNLLFSKNEPILLKAALFATDAKITILDHIHFKGNIYECVNEAFAFISKHMRWHAEMSGLDRIDVPEIPVDAIREIIVNAFAHAKFSNVVVAHEIDVFPSSVRIFNPGRLPINVNSEEYALGAKDSYLTNPTIASVLCRTSKIESFATGFRKVFSSCKDAGVEFDYKNDEYGFIFEFKRKKLYSDPNDAITFLKDTELAVYQLIKGNRNITADALATGTAKTKRTIMRVLSVLKEKGIIKRNGGTYKGHWEILK